MNQISNSNKTLYLKFPSVTKLTCPYETQSPSNKFRNTSYRSQLSAQNKVKLNPINKAEAFKIVQLPAKSEIMNICMMTMNRKKSEEVKEQAQTQQAPRRRLFSNCKLNTINLQTNCETSSFKNPLRVKKSASIGVFKKMNTVPIDYTETYAQINKILALSYGIMVESEGFSKPRKAKVDEGNNGLLVKNVIKRRLWWNAVSDDSKLTQVQNVNLLWTQSTLSNKNTQILINNNRDCFKQEDKKYESIQPNFLRYLDRVISQHPQIRKLFYTEWEEQPLRFKDLIFKLSNQPQKTLKPANLLINNHLPNNCQITNKKLLYKNMFSYFQKIGVNPNEKLPKTCHLTCFNWQEVIKDVRGDIGRWILKPGQFSNRGKGISVFRNTKQAVDYILSHPPTNEQRSYLLQQYIMPMLYLDRKFDIRCFILGVQVGGCLKFYWYEEGYIRTASDKFTINKVSKSIHLTNDAIQKSMKNYGEHQSGNKLSYSDMEKYFINNTTYNFSSQVLPEMKRISRDICHAVGDTNLIGAGTGLSFQIYGLDFLVDPQGKPWLLEVNTNPCLQVSCSLLSRILPEVIENSCRLILDIFLPPKKAPDYAQSFMQNNKYSLIYSRTLPEQQQ